MNNINDQFIKKLKLSVLEIIKNRLDHTSLKHSLGVTQKSDFSIVTLVDKEVSDLVHCMFRNIPEYNHYHFFSEEDQQSFGFPSIILDPIDGTRELAQGLGECVVSLAIMDSPTSGFAWLYNPFTGFEISSNSSYVEPVIYNRSELFGYVSKGDKGNGLLEHIKGVESLTVSPKGSIAFKLGLLASGACDFVYSKTPKNIWDIAAGTLLCWDRGIKLYQKGEEVRSLDKIRVSGELVWCRESNISNLNNSLVE